MKFARRVLLVCWDGILEILSVFISGRFAGGGMTSSISVMLGAREEEKKTHDAVCTTLNGLQKAARLSCILGMYVLGWLVSNV